MAQVSDVSIANQGFSAFRTELNNILAAFNTQHSGSSAPASLAAGSMWLDTSGGATSHILKFYDGTHHITFATINTTANTIDFSDSSITLTDDSVTLAKMASGTDGNIISYDASGNPVAVATGSAGQVLTSAGAGAPPTFATATVPDNAITLAKMASGTDGNIISYDASGNPVAIATGSSGEVLTSAGAGAPPTFSTISSGGTYSLHAVADYVETDGYTTTASSNNFTCSDQSCTLTSTGTSDVFIIHASLNGYSDADGNGYGLYMVHSDASDFSSGTATTLQTGRYGQGLMNQAYKNTTGLAKLTGLAAGAWYFRLYAMIQRPSAGTISLNVDAYATSGSVKHGVVVQQYKVN